MDSLHVDLQKYLSLTSSYRLNEEGTFTLVSEEILTLRGI